MLVFLTIEPRRGTCSTVNSPSVEPLYRVLGQRIERARTELGLTQAELADRVVPKLKRVTVSNIERGKQRILVHVLLELARVLKRPVAELLSPPEPSVMVADEEGDFAAKLNKVLSAGDAARVLSKLAATTSTNRESRRNR